MSECSVCLQEITDACRAPCQHTFCRQCILKVLEMKPPEWIGTCPLCRVHVSVYNLRDASGSCLVDQEVKTIYGSIFVQGGKIGLASYHFDSPDDCYISYANAPEKWLLDDGSKPPAKKPWTEQSYDAENLTFRGVIEWNPAFQGMVKWEYTIVFSNDFAGVIGGQVRMHLFDGKTMDHKFQAPWETGFNRALAYLRWTPPPSTIFGSVYVQGMVYSPLLEGVESYHFDTEESCYISWSNLPDTWRLDSGDEVPAKKFFSQPSFDTETRSFRGIVEWDPPFTGDSRWEYEMIFAEDFTSIVSGTRRSYGADGAEKETTMFIDPSSRSPLVIAPGMRYVQKPGVLTAGARARALAAAATTAAATE